MDGQDGQDDFLNEWIDGRSTNGDGRYKRGSKSFVLEPPLTQRPCVAIGVSPAVEHSVDNHDIFGDPIPDDKRKARRERVMPSVYLGVNSRIQKQRVDICRNAVVEVSC